MVEKALPIYSYLTGGPEIGNYQQAFEAAWSRFRSGEPVAMAADSETAYNPERSLFSFRSLGRRLEVNYPEGQARFAGTDLLPIWEWRLLALNYLGRSDGVPLSGRLITYRDLDGGQLFYGAFHHSAIEPLSRDLSQADQRLVKAAAVDLGAGVSGGGLTLIFHLFPNFPIMVRIWPGDEEIDGSANILFDASANHYLHTEDIAAAGDMTASFLIRGCRRLLNNA